MGSRGREIGYGMAYGPSEIGEENEVGVEPLFSDNYPFKQRYSSSMFLHGRKTYQSIVDFFKGLKMISRLKRGRNVPSSLSVTLCGVLCVLSVVLKGVEPFSPLWDSVKTQVFQEYEIISTRGQISIVRSRLNDIKKHELIVGENVKQNSRLILTCTAWYPSEWVYSGDADPTYTSNTTIENLGAQGQVLPLDDVNGAKRYVATIVIGPRGIKQADIGRYNCMTASPETGMKYKTLSAFYHLFVPGKTLFIRKRGGTILYDLRKSPARIPCGVTDPRVAVSLQKFQNGHLINVDNETMLYHPISGFYPRHDIPGTYVCTAGHNKAFELLHFTLVPKLTDITALQGLRQSSEEDLEWLFNSFKLGHPNRIHLSTRPPATYESERKKQKPTTHRPPQKQQSDERPTSIWKRPSEEDNNDVLVSGNAGPSTYRPVYVLFAEDLNRLKAKPQSPRPTASSSGSGSASGSGSDETEEEEEREGENLEAEAEESQSHEVDEREPDHQFHFDPQNQKNAPILLHQLYTTQRPSQVPTTPVSLRPSLHREYATTYLPFLNFLNPESAVIKYKPVVNPSESIISQYNDGSRRTTTKRPFTGQIVYDVQSNRLVYQEHVQQPNHHQQNQHQQHGHRQQQNNNRHQQNQHQQNQHQHHDQNGNIGQHSYSGFTRPTTEKPSKATSKPTRFRIPSLPTQRWPTTKKTKATTKGTTTSTTPAPPLIPDAVVCINSPCGKHATCFANTVYYHKQKETRREPACQCIDGYHGNPYLECRPPSQVETDFISFNNTGLFEKRRGSPEALSEELEEGHLKNSEVFHSNRDDVIVDLKK